MEILTGEDFEVTESIKEAAHEKFEQITHVLGEDGRVKFRFKQSGDIFDVLIEMHHRGQDFLGEHKDRDFYVALNHAKDKIVRQITKWKHKNISQKRKGGGQPMMMGPTEEELRANED